jgi:hypothetical protein
MDPRVKTSRVDLEQQFKLSKALYDQWLWLAETTDKINQIRTQLADRRATVADDEVRKHLDGLTEELQALAGGGVSRRPDPANPVNISSALTRVRALFNMLQEVDAAPTPQATAAIAEVQQDTGSLTVRWQAFLYADISLLNQRLRAVGLPTISVPR